MSFDYKPYYFLDSYFDLKLHWKNRPQYIKLNFENPINEYGEFSGSCPYTFTPKKELSKGKVRIASNADCINSVRVLSKDEIRNENNVKVIDKDEFYYLEADVEYNQEMRVSNIYISRDLDGVRVYLDWWALRLIEPLRFNEQYPGGNYSTQDKNIQLVSKWGNVVYNDKAEENFSEFQLKYFDEKLKEQGYYSKPFEEIMADFVNSGNEVAYTTSPDNEKCGFYIDKKENDKRIKKYKIKRGNSPYMVVPNLRAFDYPKLAGDGKIDKIPFYTIPFSNLYYCYFIPYGDNLNEEYLQNALKSQRDEIHKEALASYDEVLQRIRANMDTQERELEKLEKKVASQATDVAKAFDEVVKQSDNLQTIIEAVTINLINKIEKVEIS